MSLRRRGRVVLFVKIAALAANTGLVAALARLLDADAFGQVSLFLSMAVLTSVVGARGQQMALLRFLPGASPGAAPAILHATRSRALSGTLALTLLLVALAAALKAGGSLAAYDWAPLAAGLALGPLMGWADFTAHRLRASGRLFMSLVPKELIWRISVLAALGLFWLGGVDHATSLTVILLLGATLLAINAALSLTARAAGHRVETPEDLRRTAGPFWLSSVSSIFLAHADTALVGVMIGPAEAGLYFVANRLAQVLGYFMVSQNVVVAPELSAAHSAGRPDRLGAIVTRATRAMSVPTLAAGLALWALSGPVLGLFGAGFAAAAPVLGWLILAAALNAVTGPADIALNMCGQERAAMRIAAGSLLVSGLLLPVGAAFGGAIGVAIAVAAATLLRKGAYWLALLLLTGLRADILAPTRPAVRLPA